MDEVRYHECQLGSVLQNRWNLCRTTPVVVDVRLFPRPDLNFVGGQANGIINNVVVGWRCSTLCNVLRHQEKLISD